MSRVPPDEHEADRYPRAPSQAEWDRMTEPERQKVVDSLPNEVTDAEMSPPEGGFHFRAKVDAADTLRRFFGTTGRGLYVECELPVYYPAARRFAPDLLAVREVDRHIRNKWVVSAEGKGLDLVLEVHHGGDRKKDAERNLSLYASLGIPEYFIFDRARLRLEGYRLPDPEARLYQPILGQLGFQHSNVLDLDLTVLDERLRFSFRGTLLSDSVEWISQLERLVGQREQEAAAEAERARAEAERARAEAERARAEAERARAEAERADELERRVSELQAQLERLKNR